MIRTYHYFLCRRCKRVFRAIVPLADPHIPISSEEAVAITLAGLLDPRRAFCIDSCQGDSPRYIWVEDASNND